MRIITVATPLSNFPFTAVDNHLTLLILCNIAGLVDRVRLRFMVGRVPGISFPANSPTVRALDDVLVFPSLLIGKQCPWSK